ncbi:MAG TPA: hypothetical protein VEL31_05255 [Ktedonobacteraceae bacterium]|nr:hypothetical protein [Ktedonobacteraceae bacterium]
MTMQGLVEQYRRLRDAAEQHLGKGSPDYVAFWNSVDVLTKPDPKQGLLLKIASAQDAITENDQRNWNRREGYRGYYRRKIALYAQALQELDRAKEVADEATGCAN